MTQTITIPALPSTLLDAANLTRGGQFCYLAAHENKDGLKCANRLYQTGFSYENLLHRAIADIDAMTASGVMAACRDCDTVALAQTAMDQQRASYENSLQKIADGTMTSAYTEIAPGVGINENNPGYVYVRGLLVKSEVLWRKEKKPVNSRPLTLVKLWIRWESRVGDFKRFRLSPSDNFEYLAMGGRTITPADIGSVLTP